MLCLDSFYTSLNLGPLKETSVIIQLVNRSKAYPDGVIEDVLAQVNELVFPVDFYILDIEDDNSPNTTPILLGRLFLMQQTFESGGEDKLNIAISYNVEKESKTNSQRELAIDEEWEEILKFLDFG
ncbi:hypothetical protein GH714_041565 [Hevea brasiliensis]|uniref:Uncharacterized protein n=1 Tax=Hevea brasiliensis TaxID=3981 RepID=A0A6A6MSN6_HEVBR|nr:hypothetical protein GH714_041565 [Hevea brasiliensis]